MATNLFHRGVDSRVITELENRRLGKTRIRVSSYDVEEQERNGKFFPSTQRQAWVKIYDHLGNIFLAYGWDLFDELNEKYTLDNGTERLAYRLDTLETAIAGDYGSLRNFKLAFTINIRQPEKQNTQFDDIFTKAVDAFQIGKKICIQYGYKDSYDGYNKDVHHSPHDTTATGGFRAATLGDKFKDSEGNEITGEIYTVVKPEFTVASLNKIRFSISGVGPGAQIGEKNIADSFNFIPLATSDPIYHHTNTKANPVFVTDFDKSSSGGRFAPVSNIIDWIDYDVQTHIQTAEGDDNTDDFETENGIAVIGGYKPPPIDESGDYSNVGFVVFKFDEEYYTNPNQIPAADYGDAYAYYVTLQYLTWLFNWTLQPNIAGIAKMSDNRIEEIKKDASLSDYYQYIIKCDKATSNANLAFLDESGFATYVPSADPLSVIFNYGSHTKDPSKASTYGALMETYNWWYGIAGSIVGTVAGVAAGAVTFGTLAVGVGVGVGALIANAGYDDKLLNIIQFTHNDADQDQVHDARKKLSRYEIQNKFSMQQTATKAGEGVLKSSENSPIDMVSNSISGAKDKSGDMEIGNLSNILINRDCIAAIFDEMGALKRTKEKGDEDVTKISVEKFFKKLFEIIKTASGGTIQLKAIEDPDNIDQFLNKLLIINENAPPTSEQLRVPVFNKNDGSVIEMSLNSKIPKAMQVAAATQGDSNIEDIENQDNPSNAASPAEKTVSEFTIKNEKDGLVKNKFAAANVKSFASTLQKFVNRENPFTKKKVNRKLTRFPLTMTLIIQGITGFKFGDTISSKMLPPKYRKKIKNGGFETDVIFTVTKVTQQFRGNSWTTTLDTIMRFAPGNVTIKVPPDPAEKPNT